MDIIKSIPFADMKKKFHNPKASGNNCTSLVNILPLLPHLS
jgi:hypothetical protein